MHVRVEMYAHVCVCMHVEGCVTGPPWQLGAYRGGERGELPEEVIGVTGQWFPELPQGHCSSSSLNRGIGTHFRDSCGGDRGATGLFHHPEGAGTTRDSANFPHTLACAGFCEFVSPRWLP